MEVDPRRYEAAERLIFETFSLPPDEAARFEELHGREDPLWALYLSAERSFWMVEYERAARTFADVVQRDPESPLAAAGLAFLFVTGSERIAALDEIATRWPTLQRARFYLGAAHLADGRYERAVAAYERCTVMAPEDPLAWLHLSAALIRVGDRHRAADAADAALRVGAYSFPTRRSVAHFLYRARRRRRALSIATETARRSPGIRAWLLPLTLPLQAGSRRLWWVVVLFAIVLLEVSRSPGTAFRWWTLAVGFALVILLVAADFSGDFAGQMRRFRRFERARDGLREELGLTDTYRATHQPSSTP